MKASTGKNPSAIPNAVTYVAQIPELLTPHSSLPFRPARSALPIVSTMKHPFHNS